LDRDSSSQRRGSKINRRSRRMASVINGYGYGYGSGDGSGSGYGYGDGSGSGDGDGDGDGSGDYKKLGFTLLEKGK